MKKIFCITGTRADFGKLKPLLRYLDQTFELHLVVTGMHMMPLYGDTQQEVKRENYRHTYYISNQTEDDSSCTVVANSIRIFSELTRQIHPDLIIVHGDRVEALAGAMVGALENIPICHIEGGELSGTIDDSIRHAVSKLSHIHMVANEDAKNRLIQMGEQSQYIHIIGSPDLDVMSSSSLPSLEQAKAHYDIHFDQYALSLFHPVTTEYEDMQQYTKQYFAALKESHFPYVLIYPNNDLGSHFILDEIHKLPQEQFRRFPSLRFEYFLTLLKHCTFMIGNSSAGVRESPFYGVRSVNVGTRQNSRAIAPSIINCTYEIEDILQAINLAKTPVALHSSFNFGTGNSATLFKQCLENPDFWQIPIQKTFCSYK